MHFSHWQKWQVLRYQLGLGEYRDEKMLKLAVGFLLHTIIQVRSTDIGNSPCSSPPPIVRFVIWNNRNQTCLQDMQTKWKCMKDAVAAAGPDCLDSSITPKQSFRKLAFKGYSTVWCLFHVLDWNNIKMLNFSTITFWICCSNCSEARRETWRSKVDRFVDVESKEREID